mmetsp:Transcript_7495/g.23123  ORF Transcript_7495/g.23123 Transcript_7495/m.23123 type:complete len:250 (-) Transcript_7495:834-1583(-)
MTAMRAPSMTLSPSWTRSWVTPPETGALTLTSIFMAETTKSSEAGSTASPTVTLTFSTTPGMGEATWLGLDGSATGPSNSPSAAGCLTSTCCSAPSTSKTTVRMRPALSGPTRFRVSVTSACGLPSSDKARSAGTLVIVADWPTAKEYQKTGVGTCAAIAVLVSQNDRYSSITFGYSKEALHSSSETSDKECFSASAFLVSAKSAGCKESDGRSVSWGLPFRIALATSSGKPRCGKPRRPSMRPTTESG